MEFFDFFNCLGYFLIILDYLIILDFFEIFWIFLPFLKFFWVLKLIIVVYFNNWLEFKKLNHVTSRSKG
jgi:hypothetical protein